MTQLKKNQLREREAAPEGGGGRHLLYSPECLDWQPSQFINIVGKDDVAKSGSGGGGEVLADLRHSLPVARETQPNRILPSHSETF
jgi:hypothetical protein